MVAGDFQHIMTSARVERENAMDYLVQVLRTEKAADPDFPQLSKGAMRALAVELVTRNGINYQLNDQQMFAELRENRHRWEYYGVTGMLRAIYRKIFIKTEEVSQWRRDRSNH